MNHVSDEPMATSLSQCAPTATREMATAVPHDSTTNQIAVEAHLDLRPKTPIVSRKTRHLAKLSTFALAAGSAQQLRIVTMSRTLFVFTAASARLHLAIAGSKGEGDRATARQSVATASR